MIITSLYPTIKQQLVPTNQCNDESRRNEEHLHEVDCLLTVHDDDDNDNDNDNDVIAMQCYNYTQD
jgi:hypothetical protein